MMTVGRWVDGDNVSQNRSKKERDIYREKEMASFVRSMESLGLTNYYMG